MLAVMIVEGLAIAALGLLVAGLLRSHADILRRLAELGGEVGADRAAPGTGRRGPAPARSGVRARDLSGTTLGDEAVVVAVDGAAQDTVLAFLSTGCASCARFWASFRDPDLASPGGARVVVVSRDATEESPARLAELATDRVPLVLSSAAWEDYRVPGSPYFVYVEGATGRVLGEGTGSSWQQVSSLLGQALAESRRAANGVGGDPVEQELAAAGIGPGHPSLYGPPDRPTSEA